MAIVTPASAGKPLGYLDATALAEFTAYDNLIGSAGWQGMTATGTLTSAATPNGVSATLTMSPGNFVTLDVTKSAGHDITVIYGTFGTVAHAASTKLQPLATSAALSGIAPFDMPGWVAAAPTSYAVIDDGTVALQEKTCHRITVQGASVLGGVWLPASERQVPIDFYFDPQSHLLFKTASLITMPGVSPEVLLRVITYGDYQTVGGELMPSTISETIDGKSTWALHLTSIQLTTPPSN